MTFPPLMRGLRRGAYLAYKSPAPPSHQNHDRELSPPHHLCRRAVVRRAAGAGRAHARRPLWPRPRRAVVQRRARLHADGDRGGLVADRDGGFFRRLFYRNANAERGIRTNPAADAPVPDRGRRAAAGWRRPSGLRAGADLHRRGRAGRPRSALPWRGDVVLRRTFRAATGVIPVIARSPSLRGALATKQSSPCLRPWIASVASLLAMAAIPSPISAGSARLQGAVYRGSWWANR